LGDKAKIPIGVVFSTTGPYATIGEAMLNGALLAIEEVNKSPDFDFELTPLVRNPGGDTAQYGAICRDLILNSHVTHVVGCYTSSSRKEIVPVVEKYDSLLWYPSHYEGFESSGNVVYLGASPNQHIVPLAQYMASRFGARVYCCGSDYIWPWESNRVMREIVENFGGEVLAERYLAVGSTEVTGLVEEIRQLRPDFVFNTLIGESSYAFVRAFHDAGLGTQSADVQAVPIASCTLSEPELRTIGDPAALGHISSSVYFQSLDNPQNIAFVANYRARFGQGKVTSADAEASYDTIHMLALALRAAASAAAADVLAVLGDCVFEAPQGRIRIDTDNNHCYLTPRIGISSPGAEFTVLAAAQRPIKPDPFLASLKGAAFMLDSPRDQESAGLRQQPKLRVVS
jgi:branched-chain amino acid transport system substrate-binding protein